ncbi:MAG: His-Xaa-Ser system protein HxsD [Elusimicrobiota bacterium]
MTGTHFDIRTAIYPLEAIYAACYAFIDRAYVRLDERPKKTIRVFLDSKEPPTEGEMRRLEGDFRNELLHHALRLRVSAANQKIREYVVTRALLSVQPSQEGEPLPAMEDEPVEEPAAPEPAREDRAPAKKKPAAEPAPEEAHPAAPEMAGPGASQAQAAPTPEDDALAKEIQKLLAEIDKGGEGEDPLGIVAPWEESQGKQGKAARASKPKKTKKGKR